MCVIFRNEFSIGKITNGNISQEKMGRATNPINSFFWNKAFTAKNLSTKVFNSVAKEKGDIWTKFNAFNEILCVTVYFDAKGKELIPPPLILKFE